MREDQATLEQAPNDERLAFGWSFRRWLLAVVALAATVQAVMLASVWTWTFRNGDALFYQGQASLNAEGHWFVNPYRYLQWVFQTPSQTPIYIPSASHPPLTSTLLTVANWIGLTTFREHSIFLSLVFIATVVLVAVAIKLSGGPKVALVAAGLVATSPYLFVNPSANLAETAVLLTVALLLVALFRLIDQPGPWRAVLVGAAAGLGALSRSELAMMVATVVAPTIWLAVKVPWKSRLLLLGAAAIGFSLVTGPWLVRNQTTFKKSVWFSDQLGVTLIEDNCPMTYSGYYMGWQWIACGLQVSHPQLEALNVLAGDQGTATAPGANQDLQRWTGKVTQASRDAFAISVTGANAAAKLWHNPAGDGQEVPFAVTAKTSGRPAIALGQMVTVESRLLFPLDESVADLAYKKVGMSYIKTHKLRALEVAGIRFLRVWNLYAPKSQVMFDYQDARPHAVSWLGLGVYYLSLPLAIYGAFIRRRRGLTNAPFIGFFVTASIAVMMTFANGRYRVEGDLAISILAAFGIVELARGWRLRRQDEELPR
jgi:4-amino-4-deoxy-L-arabinose transferase-like glycosyltransferase